MLFRKYIFCLCFIVLSFGITTNSNAATATSTGSGSWSSAIWSGGSGGGGAPADGDAVVIAAGHSVKMDANLSAWTGLYTVTIQGGATPGCLYFSNGTDGYLKIRTGYNLVGTSGANKGRLLANSDGIWETNTSLQYSNKAVISLQGTSKIDAQYLDIKMLASNPTNKYVRVYGTKYDFVAGASTVSTGNDTVDLGVTPPSVGSAVRITTLSGTLPGGLTENFTYYIRSVSGNTCKLAKTNEDATISDITSVGSGTCTIFTGVGSGSSTISVLDDVTSDDWSSSVGHNYAVLCNVGQQNYDIQGLTISSFDSGSMTLSASVDSVQLPGSMIVLSSRNVQILGNGTSSTQSIIDYANASTSSGIFACEIRNNAWGGSTTFYGYGINLGSGHTISGTITGNSYGINLGTGCTISGAITGNSNGIYSGSGNTISGAITGNNSGIYSGSGHTISGTITGNSYGINSGSGHTISGAITGNGADFRGTIDTNIRNALITNPPSIYGGRNQSTVQTRIRCENCNPLGSPINMVYDMMGDVTAIPFNGNSIRPLNGPSGELGSGLEASNVQSNLGLVRITDFLRILEGQRIWLTAGDHTVRYYIQTTYPVISLNNLVLMCEYIGNNGALVKKTSSNAIYQRSSNTDWSQYIEVNFTATLDGWANFNMDLFQYESGGLVYIWPIPYIY